MKKSKKALRAAAPRSIAAQIEEERQKVRADAVQLAMRLRAENTRLHTGEGHAACDVQTCEIAAVASDEASGDAGLLAENERLRALLVEHGFDVGAETGTRSDSTAICQLASEQPAAAPLNEEVKP